MNYTNLVTDAASILAIIGGLQIGFRWLRKEVFGWVRGEIQPEIRRVVQSEIKPVVTRIELLEAWQTGYITGKLERKDA